MGICAKPVRFWLPMLLLSMAVSSPIRAATPEPRLLLPEFDALSRRATNSVTITLDAPLLAAAARFLDARDPDEASVRDIISGLKGIYVRSYTFENDIAFPKADVDALRKQLAAPGWQKIVEVHSTNPSTAVDVYIFQTGAEAGGLAIIAAEPREFTVVNIVGTIDLDKLHKLEGHFGVPKLPEKG